MGTRITINEARLLDYHDQLLDELYKLYHIHPTKIVNYHPSQSELLELEEYAQLGQSLSKTNLGQRLIKMGGASGNIRIQQVQFEKNNKFSNGLPRRK